MTDDLEVDAYVRVVRSHQGVPFMTCPRAQIVSFSDCKCEHCLENQKVLVLMTSTGATIWVRRDMLEREQ